jgi:magnesium chelatase subunit I
MDMGRRTYPFTAIVGQERMKQALLLNAINPAIGGVLIRGDRGTAKSTAVRALAALLADQVVVEGCQFGCDPDQHEALCEECRTRDDSGGVLPRTTRQMRVVELPVNASEDRVVGTIDLEAAFTEGVKRFEKGILGAAHRNVLYVDEVNLLDDHIIDVLLDAAATGVNVVEREGLSISHPSRFILVGTMNPDEGDLRPQLLDRFGLCVEVVGCTNVDERVDIADLRTSWDADPATFAAAHAEKESELRTAISAATQRCPEVAISRGVRRMIANLSLILDVDGHRPDLVLARSAQALAAMEGAEAVDVQHLGRVAEMVYLHRRGENSKEVAPMASLISRVAIAESRRPEGSPTAAGLPSLRPINT